MLISQYHIWATYWRIHTEWQIWAILKKIIEPGFDVQHSGLLIDWSDRRQEIYL